MNYFKRMMFVPIITLTLFSTDAKCIIGDFGAGWAQVPYLVQILNENIKRYKQLESIMDNSKQSEEYLRQLQQGLDQIRGLVQSLPIQNENILAEIRSYEAALETIESTYGKIVPSQDSSMVLLHDQTVAESMNMVHQSKRYAETQDRNAQIAFEQSNATSLKGAARLNSQTNAQVLQTLSQLLKVNVQILKLQSEQLAMNTGQTKAQSRNYDQVNSAMRTSLKSFNGDFRLSKF